MEQKLCPGCEEPEVDKLPGCPLQCRTIQCKAYKEKPIFDYQIMPIVWIIGGPGSGKRTLCQKIVGTYGFTSVSPGDMIRQELANGSVRSRCLNSVTGRGGLVPNDIVLALIKQAIEKAAVKGTRGFVIEGFPREKTQGPLFERGVGPASLILYLETTVKTMFHRMKTRAKDLNRIDETPDAIKLRLETFLKYNESVVEFYKYRLVKIHAEISPDLVFDEVKAPMEELMKNAKAAMKTHVKISDVLEKSSTPTGSGAESPPNRKHETNK